MMLLILDASELHFLQRLVAVCVCVCVCVILNIWQMELSDMVLRCKVYCIAHCVKKWIFYTS